MAILPKLFHPEFLGMGTVRPAKNSLRVSLSSGSLVAKCESGGPGGGGADHALLVMGNLAIRCAWAARARAAVCGPLYGDQYHRIFSGSRLLFFCRSALCPAFFNFLWINSRIYRPNFYCQLCRICLVVSVDIWVDF